MEREVFISYHNTSSLEVARKIVSALDARGITSWCAFKDSAGIYAGQITHAIENCKVFIVILNQAASKRKNVLTEMNIAFGMDDLVILPFHIADEVKDLSDDAKYYLRLFHFIDGRKNLDKGIEKLMDHVLLHLGREQQHPKEESGQFVTLNYCGQTHRVKAETYNFQNGVFTGDLENGKPQGRGRYVSSNGDVYEGEWKNSRYHGKGRYSFTNGNVFEGEFAEGIIHGKGKLTQFDGSFHDGYWENGKITGYGVWYTKDGDFYEGEFMNGVCHGKAKYTWANGNVFEGEWVNGKRNGYGVFTTKDGKVTMGHYKDDKFVG